MHRPLIALLALGLTACTGAGTFDTGRSFINGSRTSFAELTAGGELETIVVGNPFAVDDDAFGRAVATTLNQRNSLARVDFTTAPARPTGNAIVLAFNAGGVRPSDLCRDPRSTTTSPGAAPITMNMVFCRGESAISGRRGRLASATGPDDPAFQNFLGTGLALAQPTGFRRVGDDISD